MQESPEQSIETAKARLRQKVRSQITVWDAGARSKADDRIRGLLEASPLLAVAGIVAAFLPLPDEPDLRPLLRTLLGRGLRVALPEVMEDQEPRMRFVAVDDAEALARTRPAALGTSLPIDAHPIEPSSIGAMLVPGVAFDLLGHRLGRGRGYFDAFLSELPRNVPRIGIAYECQVVPAVPVAAHDSPVDWLCTERRLLETG